MPFAINLSTKKYLIIICLVENSQKLFVKGFELLKLKRMKEILPNIIAVMSVVKKILTSAIFF